METAPVTEPPKKPRLHVRAMAGRTRRIVTHLAIGKSGVATVVQNFGVQGATLVGNLVTGLIVARALGPTGRGEQAAVSMWVVLLSALSTFGIPEALRYRARQQFERRGQLLLAATISSVGSGLLAALAGFVIIPLLMHKYGHVYVREAQLLMAFSPAFVMILVLRAYLETFGNFRRSNATLLCLSGCTLIALITLEAFHRLTPLTAPLAYTAPVALVVAGLAFTMRADFRLGNFVDCLKSLSGYGSKVFGTEIFRAFSTQIDQAIILTFLSPRSLGLYAVALTVSRTMMMIPQSAWNVVFSRVAGQSADDAVPLVLRGARITLGVSALAALVFVLAQPVLVPFVYGAAFAAAVPLSIILTVEATLGSTAWMLSVSFSATGRPFVSTITQGVWLACTIVLLFLLVPRMQVLGAAFALLGATTIRLGLVCALYRIVLKRPLPRLLPHGEDLAYLRLRLRAVGVRT